MVTDDTRSKKPVLGLDDSPMGRMKTNISLSPGTGSSHSTQSTSVRSAYLERLPGYRDPRPQRCERPFLFSVESH